MAILFPKKSSTFLVIFNPSSSLNLLLFSSLLSSLVFASRPNTSKALPITHQHQQQQQQCIHDHFSALLYLKQGFHFPDYGYTTLSSWNPNNRNCCSWEGITCETATGLVIALDISNGRIQGRLDFGSLSRLRSLQRLNLASNYFDSSPIPTEIAQLTGLIHLNLSLSNLHGQIPMEISHLTSLVSLDLSSNDLILENPNFGALFHNMLSLRQLYLDGVNISREGSDWSQVLSSSLPRLRKLSLSGCHLSGTIHPSLFQLRFLSELDLSYNNLSSAVLRVTGNLPSLTSLRLMNCGLHGELPDSMFSLPNLRRLDISENPLLTGNLPEFRGNNTIQHLILSHTGFSGELPHSIGSLKYLIELRMNSCNLSGSLPSSLVNLSKLQYLDLSSNNFSGPIPSSHGNGLADIKWVDLSNNSLDGSIPSFWFSLPSLQMMFFGGNQLGGQLSEFHNASSSKLEQIFLEGNNLQGMIPRSIFELKKLITIYLPFNNFSGAVDLTSFRHLKNLIHLDLSDNSLSVYDGSRDSTFTYFPQMYKLKLRSCNISKFPSSLRNLEALIFLDLSNNRISGEIPKWIWKVGNGTLYSLNLSHNALQGNIPSFPSLSIRRFQVLDLSYNSLKGSLPIPPPSTLFFSVSNNRLSGEIPLSFCNSTSLQLLDLSENHLSGSIPQCLGEISDVLVVLNLRGNAFKGTMLQTFKEECRLQTLDLSNNQLQGQVPMSLANCKMLEVLNIGNNQIHGIFPSWMEALSQLRILVVRSNKFFGPIPGPLKSFPLLQIIDLSSNNFSGSLPWNIFQNWEAMMERDVSSAGPIYLTKTVQSTEGQAYYKDTTTLTSKGQEMQLEKILTVFTAVDLSNNHFEGNIPDSIGILRSLRVLNMSHNGFTGLIPTSLENLTVLESLDLSCNDISGEIPWQLTKLTFLSVLNLSQNLLVGSIPQIKQFLTFTNESFQGNLGLCGPPLSKKCGDGKAAPPSEQPESKYVDWDFIWMGFGVGQVVGIGMFVWTLILWTKGRRKYNGYVDRMLLKLFPSALFAQKQRR